MTEEMDFPDSSETAWLSLRRGSYVWDLDPIAKSWLNDDGELPISAWLDSEEATVVKHGPHRTVYRLKLAGGSFYLKHYRTPDWQAVFQNLLRPSKADLEWEAAGSAMASGLRTFETIAVGRKRKLGVVLENFLVSREIPGAVPLDQFVLETFPQIPAKQQIIARRGIARELGHVASRLHRNGLLHRDLHPANLLIGTDDEGFPLYLIDLHAMSQKSRLSFQQIARNLALLNNFFYRLSSKTDRLRFLKSYLNGQETPAAFHKQAARLIEKVCRAELAKADRRGDKKWRRGNRRLLILEDSPNRCRGLAEVGKAQLERFRDQPEQLFDRSRFIGWRKTDSPVREGVMEIPIDGEPRRANLSVRPKDGSARSAWEMGHALLRRRLPAARPLFFVETKAGPWDYLVIEEISKAISLKSWLRKQASQPTDHRALNAVIQGVGNLLKRFHEQGFHQRELTLSSILIREEPGGPALWLVHMETIIQLREVGWAQMIQSLAELWHSLPAEIRITRSERLRFLRGYLGRGFSQDWRTVWRAIGGCSATFKNREAA